MMTTHPSSYDNFNIWWLLANVGLLLSMALLPYLIFIAKVLFF